MTPEQFKEMKSVIVAYEQAVSMKELCKRRTDALLSTTAPLTVGVVGYSTTIDIPPDMQPALRRFLLEQFNSMSEAAEYEMRTLVPMGY